MPQTSQLQFVNGRAEIKKGRKSVAWIYDRAVYYAFNCIKSAFAPEAAFSVNIAGVGQRECASAEEALGFVEKYAA